MPCYWRQNIRECPSCSGCEYKNNNVLMRFRLQDPSSKDPLPHDLAIEASEPTVTLMQSLADESISDTPCTVKSQQVAQYIADSFADTHSECVVKGSATNQVRLDCAYRHETMGPLMETAKEFYTLCDS